MSSTRNFRDKIKMKYTRGIVPSEVNVPGSQFYGNLYGNSQMLNQIYGFLKKNPPDRPNPPPPPPEETKIVAILDFSDTTADQRIIATLNYYFDNVPRFYRFPIVNYEGNTNKLINLLDQYYAQGFRYFLTATLTPALLSVINWFNFHPEAQGISSGSRLPSLEIPKSIFRMQYPDTLPLTSIEIVGKYDSVFFVYNSANQTTVYANTYLSNLCEEKGVPYYSWGVSSISEITDTDFVNNTMSEINSIILNNNYKNVSVSSAMVNLENAYYNKFVFGTTTLVKNATFYNIGVSLPNIQEVSAQNYFLNVPLYAQTVASLSTSPLWRQGIESLGSANYSETTLNVMELLYKLDDVNGYSNELGSYSDSVIFDLTTRDQQYEAYVYNLYSANNIFKPAIIYYREPTLKLFYKGLVENNSN